MMFASPIADSPSTNMQTLHLALCGQRAWQRAFVDASCLRVCLRVCVRVCVYGAVGFVRHGIWECGRMFDRMLQL